MTGTILRPENTSLLKSEIMQDGKLRIMPSKLYHGLSENLLKNFIMEQGIYVLPTTELVEWLREQITGEAIEIGAGNGAIARALGIPITDSRMQEQEEVKVHYRLTGQPTIKYPDDVEKLNYREAIYKYKPSTVIGAFITHKWKDGSGNYWGVDEEWMLKRVRRYINIGNLNTHKEKPILKFDHKSFYFPWLITRAADQKLNRIFLFEQ